MDNATGAPQRCAIGAVVLAAGLSRRFGPDNKLLAQIDGKPMIEHTIAQLIAARVSELVVVGPPDRSIADVVLPLGVRVVINPDPEHGLMGSSIAIGVASLSSNVEGIMIMPGDMPAMSANLIERLMAVFAATQADKIVCPVTSDGDQRNPVIWPRRFRAPLMALNGQLGGKDLLRSMTSQIEKVSVPDEGALTDIDTPDDLMAFAERRGAS